VGYGSTDHGVRSINIYSTKIVGFSVHINDKRGFRMNIPFNKPYMTGKELWHIAQAHANGHLAGDGHFTRLCASWLEGRTGVSKALLTHSCTAGLEMAAILADLKPGDEVIMPSYTFVSTANAFVLRGAIPVFVDIRADTLNIDESLIESAITSRTRAIVPVHYAGVACEMDAITAISRRHNLLVIEDAAQAVMANYKGRALGSIGDMAAFSFHETKNIISGEGGALLCNKSVFAERAEIIREKGTNRSQFFRGQVDKYTWVDVGSSYLPSELIAAFLWAQMEEADSITQRRVAIWNRYHAALASLEEMGQMRRPVIPPGCEHNAHMYYLLLPDLESRTAFIADMQRAGINCVFHYIPLHSAPAAALYGRAHGDLSVTQQTSDRLVRLPLWLGLEQQQEYVIDTIREILSLQRTTTN
jgi:dTDP-4-amino-4,6-dideoxygalactose transaminase